MAELFRRAEQQKSVLRSVQFLKKLQSFRRSTSLQLTEEDVNNHPRKKLLKVAILGRPNAGKSTLINSILKLNVCGVSHKTHTTRTPFRAAFTTGETQVVFVDTPGLVTQKEYARFRLNNEFLTWKKEVLNEADVIGIVHEISEPEKIFKFHLNLTQNINDLPESKPLFLVLNKIDLILNKNALSAAIESCFAPNNLEKPHSKKRPKVWEKFSRIFFTAALKDTGVSDVVEYLVSQARPGEWLFENGRVFDKPLHDVVTELLRARLMDILPQEIPYQCKYEVEYLKENSLVQRPIFCILRCNTAFEEEHSTGPYSGLPVLTRRKSPRLRGPQSSLQVPCIYHLVGLKLIMSDDWVTLELFLSEINFHLLTSGELSSL